MPDLLQTVESSTDRLMIENTIIIQVYFYFCILLPDLFPHDDVQITA
jgi:hypothetical protein